MKIDNIKKLNNTQIVNIVISLISDHQMFINSWGEFIFGKELNFPPELKNRIFCIWFSGALYTIEDMQDQYLPLLDQLEIRKLENCIFLLKQFKRFTESLENNVCLIDKDSQLILNHQRNALVQASVSYIHINKSIELKYFDPKTKNIVKFNENSDEFWKIWRKLITGTLDEFYNPLREKFFDTKSAYYTNCCKMTKPLFFKVLSDKAYKDIKKPRTPRGMIIN